MPYMAGRTQVNILSSVDSDAAGLNVLSRRKARRLERRAPSRGDQLDGISLKKIAKGVKKIATPVQRVVKKAGHAIGKAATSTVGQAIVGTALAVSGVGIPAAAAIGAAVKGGGALIKPGGNLGTAGRAAGQGAIVGAGSAVVGKGVRKGISLVKREKVPAPATSTTSQLDQVIAQNKLPEVSQVPSSTAVLKREKALTKTRTGMRALPATPAKPAAKPATAILTKTATAITPLVEPVIKAAAVDDARAREKREQRKKRIREAQAAVKKGAVQALETSTAGAESGGGGGGGGGGSASAGGDDPSSLTAIANQATEGAGGFGEFLKNQNPLVLGGAALALVAGAVAMSRGGGRMARA